MNDADDLPKEAYFRKGIFYILVNKYRVILPVRFSAMK